MVTKLMVTNVCTVIAYFCDIAIVITWIIVIITGGIETHKYKKRNIDLRRAKLFSRKYEDKFGRQTLGNKYCSITFIPDAKSSSNNILRIINKHNGQEIVFYLYTQNFDKETIQKNLCDTETIIMGTKPITQGQFQNFWARLCNDFWYDTTFENVITNINKAFKDNLKTIEENSLDQILLNINECSAAEMLSIPGMTIAKAQKAVKFREKTKNYPSLLKFLEIAKVSQEYHQKIESMKLSGTSSIISLEINKKITKKIL